MTKIIFFLSELLAINAFANATLQSNSSKDATIITQQFNSAIRKQLPFSNTQDFEYASHGFIGTTPNLHIYNDKGAVVWDLTAYAFLKNDSPNTANPSLWRQAQLNMNNGIFKVIDNVYQVRGFDLSNMTIIESKTGLILIDPLISPETAKAGLELYFQYRPKKPIVAVIYTHSHVDHYGGVKGVVNEADVNSGKIKIFAPEHFLEEVISENVYAGNAMARRGIYQYGPMLPKNERGQIDSGLGKTTSLGASTLIPPTQIIKHTGEKHTIDGVQIEFLMAPDTEAPAEMLFYFPQFRMLEASEDATHNFHNIYTLRGAKIRDAKKWWKTLNETLVRYGDKVDVVIAQHHWPTWGQKNVVEFLENQRDLYKFILDRTLNLANQGFTSVEIAEQIQLPKNLGNKWYDRNYYGSVNHNAKGVYQRYLGWYDSNPAHLYQLPPVPAAKHYVEYMGGASQVIEKAKKSFAKGEYRWVAEIMNQVVFAEPSNQEARNLGADALEQLGYQTENAAWRNNFLMGAFELRNGVPNMRMPGVATPDVVQAMTPEMLLDYMGIKLNAVKAEGKMMNFIWKQPGFNDFYAIEVRNSVVMYTKNKKITHIDATLNMDKLKFANALMGSSVFVDEIKNGNAKITGDSGKFVELFGMLDTFQLMFNIITPNEP